MTCKIKAGYSQSKDVSPRKKESIKGAPKPGSLAKYTR